MIPITKEDMTVSFTFDQMLDDYYEEGLKLDPLFATIYGDNRYNNKFPNVLSSEYTSELKVYYSKYLEKLSRFNNEDLSESEKMSKAVLKWDCDINLKRLSFRQDLFPIDQMWSINLIVGSFASGVSAQPFKSVEDYYNWLERLDGYVEWMASAENKMREGIELGYVLPRSLIIKVIPQLEAHTVEDIEKHLFYTPVINFPKTFSPEEKKILSEAYTRMLAEKIIPAYKSLHHFMKTDYLQAGRETSGIDAIPNGKAYYRHQIKEYTTTNMTIDEIHQLGDRKSTRLNSSHIPLSRMPSSA